MWAGCTHGRELGDPSRGFPFPLSLSKDRGAEMAAGMGAAGRAGEVPSAHPRTPASDSPAQGSFRVHVSLPGPRSPREQRPGPPLPPCLPHRAESYLPRSRAPGGAGRFLERSLEARRALAVNTCFLIWGQLRGSQLPTGHVGQGTSPSASGLLCTHCPPCSSCWKLPSQRSGQREAACAPPRAVGPGLQPSAEVCGPGHPSRSW